MDRLDGNMSKNEVFVNYRILSKKELRSRKFESELAQQDQKIKRTRTDRLSQHKENSLKIHDQQKDPPRLQTLKGHSKAAQSALITLGVKRKLDEQTKTPPSKEQDESVEIIRRPKREREKDTKTKPTKKLCLKRSLIEKLENHEQKLLLDFKKYGKKNVQNIPINVLENALYPRKVNELSLKEARDMLISIFVDAPTSHILRDLPNNELIDLETFYIRLLDNAADNFQSEAESLKRMPFVERLKVAYLIYKESPIEDMATTLLTDIFYPTEINDITLEDARELITIELLDLNMRMSLTSVDNKQIDGFYDRCLNFSADNFSHKVTNYTKSIRRSCRKFETQFEKRVVNLTGIKDHQVLQVRCVYLLYKDKEVKDVALTVLEEALYPKLVEDITMEEARNLIDRAVYDLDLLKSLSKEDRESIDKFYHECLEYVTFSAKMEDEEEQSPVLDEDLESRLNKLLINDPSARLMKENYLKHKNSAIKEVANSVLKSALSPEKPENLTQKEAQDIIHATLIDFEMLKTLEDVDRKQIFVFYEQCLQHCSCKFSLVSKSKAKQPASSQVDAVMEAKIIDLENYDRINRIKINYRNTASFQEFISNEKFLQIFMNFYSKKPKAKASDFNILLINEHCTNEQFRNIINSLKNLIDPKNFRDRDMKQELQPRFEFLNRCLREFEKLLQTCDDDIY